VNTPCAHETNWDIDTGEVVMPTPTPLPSPFQPLDGSTLMWRRYVPPGTGPFPTIIIVHGGGFVKGDLFEGGQERAANYLLSKGYFVLSVSYRLAPPWTDYRTAEPQHLSGIGATP